LTVRTIGGFWAYQTHPHTLSSFPPRSLYTFNNNNNNVYSTELATKMHFSSRLSSLYFISYIINNINNQHDARPQIIYIWMPYVIMIRVCVLRAIFVYFLLSTFNMYIFTLRRSWEKAADKRIYLLVHIYLLYVYDLRTTKRRFTILPSTISIDFMGGRKKCSLLSAVAVLATPFFSGERCLPKYRNFFAFLEFIYSIFMAMNSPLKAIYILYRYKLINYLPTIYTWLSVKGTTFIRSPAA
jgi:hypothetical protein